MGSWLRKSARLIRRHSRRCESGGEAGWKRMTLRSMEWLLGTLVYGMQVTTPRDFLIQTGLG